MLRVLPKIGEKVMVYSLKSCGAEQNFAHGVFLGWHILLHINVFKISKHCLRGTLGLNIKVCTSCGIMLLGSKSVAL